MGGAVGGLEGGGELLEGIGGWGWLGMGCGGVC